MAKRHRHQHQVEVNLVGAIITPIDEASTSSPRTVGHPGAKIYIAPMDDSRAAVIAAIVVDQTNGDNYGPNPQGRTVQSGYCRKRGAVGQRSGSLYANTSDRRKALTDSDWKMPTRIRASHAMTSVKTEAKIDQSDSYAPPGTPLILRKSEQ